MSSKSPIAVLICAVCIGLICMYCGVDDVSVWVLEFAHSVPWSDLLLPVPLPPPMQDFVFRPLSLLLMKATWVLSGNSLAIPPWLIGIKAAIFSAVFGMGAWLWLQRWVSHKIASILAIVSMVCEPALFSAFNYSEFDGFGAGLILLSSWWLNRYPERWLGFALISFCIVFLKESSFFIWLCFIAPQLVEPWIMNRSKDWKDYRAVTVVVCLMSLWLFGTTSVLSGKVQSAAGGLGWMDRVPVFQFTTWQLVALWSETGVVLVLLGHWRRWTKILFVGWLCVALVEPLSQYNHYETYYFSRPWYWTVLSVGLLLTWCMATVEWIRGAQTLHSVMAVRGLLMMGLFALVIFTSSNLREDLASRLFLSLLPGMCALVWLTLKQWWQKVPLRRMGLFLVGLQCWTVVASGWNWVQRIWFESGNHADWTMEMLQQFDSKDAIGRPIWVTDMSRRYSTVRNQSLLSLEHSVPLSELEFAPFCYFQSGETQDFARSMRSQSNRNTYVLHRGRQLHLSEESLNIVRADYSYLRASNRGAHGPIQEGDGRCTNLSLIEDRYLYAHSPSDPLQPYLNFEFESIHQVEAWYYQVPTRFLNVPLWLWQGVPFLQPWRIQQSLWVFPV